MATLRSASERPMVAPWIVAVNGPQRQSTVAISGRLAKSALLSSRLAPRNQNGSSARSAETFVKRLEQTGAPVLGSVVTRANLPRQERRRLKRRSSVDQVAATLLLQGYLDYRAGRGKETDDATGD